MTKLRRKFAEIDPNNDDLYGYEEDATEVDEPSSEEEEKKESVPKKSRLEPKPVNLNHPNNKISIP